MTSQGQHSRGQLSRDEADQLLTGIGAAYDRIAAAMYAIDTHRALTLLRGGLLTGSTESRWRALRPEIDLLWAYFATLGQVLEEARSARARRRPADAGWAEVTRLLCDQVVELDADALPHTGIGLTQPATAHRMALGELAQQLEQRCATVTGHLSEVDSSFSAVAARLAQVAAAVEEVATRAHELGESTLGQRLRAALEQTQRVDLADPLLAAPGGRLSRAAEARWAALAAETDQARRTLVELARVRESYPALRTSLGSLVDDVGRAEQAVVTANGLATEKIASAGLAAAPAATAGLRARLDELDQLHARAQSDATVWRQLVGDVAEVELSAQQARDRARELRALAEGLIARRDELRGRLSAYRAKAAARGFGEHPDLTTLHARARDALFAAPCDLRASTRAVHAYQQALATVLATHEERA